MAEHRHKRDTDARRKPRAVMVAAPLAVLATASVVTIGVASTNQNSDDVVAAQNATTSTSPSPEASASRSGDVISRAMSRLAAEHEARIEALERRKERQRKAALARERAATLRAVRAADTPMWTTTALNLWSDSGADAVQVGLIEAGEKVLVTGRETADRVEVVVDGRSRWVTAGYLTDEKPVEEEPTPTATAEPASPDAAPGLSMEPCPDSSVEDGITSDAVYVYRSVCNAFPEITTYGGWDDHGEHASGRAIDIMTSDVELGNAIADFLQEHAAELNLYDIIWRQRIWTPERASEGWRWMPSRGSATADHYDHVHVATNG